MDSKPPKTTDFRPGSSKARLAFALICVTALLLAGCSTKASASSGGPTKANPKLKTGLIRAGSTIITAEIARTEDEREKGLMFRTSLKDGNGMLFIFDADQILAFWMKNTSLPLSLAYISRDGTIKEIHDLIPRSLEGVPSEVSVRYALEVPQGYFARAGIKAGDRLELPLD